MADNDPAKLKLRFLGRVTYMMLAWIFLGLGVVGAFLPLLPTTVFIILAAWAFARSSPEREAWLLNHKTLGPPLRRWRKYHAISAKAKYLAFGLLTVSSLFSVWMLQARPVLMGIALVCLFGVLVIIYRLPLLPDHVD